MRRTRQLLLVLPIALVGAMSAAIVLLPQGLADAAIWGITGVSGLSIGAYLILAKLSHRPPHRPEQRLTPGDNAGCRGQHRLYSARSHRMEPPL